MVDTREKQAASAAAVAPQDADCSLARSLGGLDERLEEAQAADAAKRRLRVLAAHRLVARVELRRQREHLAHARRQVALSVARVRLHRRALPKSR